LLRRTKNGDPRQVKLHPTLLEALREQVRALGPGHDDRLLFEVETRWGIPQLVRRLQKRAGLQHYRPHVIGRHAFASRLLNAGESTITVKDAGGWKNTRMIDEYYGHLAQSRTDQVVAGIDASRLENSHPNHTQSERKEQEAPENFRKNVA
jgi:integrase